MKNITEERTAIYFNFVDTACEYIMKKNEYTEYDDIVAESKDIANVLFESFDDVDEESARAFQAYAEMKMLQIRNKKTDPELFDADE